MRACVVFILVCLRVDDVLFLNQAAGIASRTQSDMRDVPHTTASLLSNHKEHIAQKRALS